MEHVMDAVALSCGVVFGFACIAVCAIALRFIWDTSRPPHNARAVYFRVLGVMRGEWPELRSARMLRRAVGLMLSAWLLGAAAVVVRIVAEQM